MDEIFKIVMSHKLGYLKELRAEIEGGKAALEIIDSEIKRISEILSE